MEIAEPTLYRHRQIGWSMIGFAIAIIVFFEVFVARLPPSRHGPIPPWLPFALAMTVVVLFYQLEISVTRSQLIWRFGIGLISGRAALDELVGSEAVRTSMASGWGIRYTSRGMLYNISGLDALLVTRTNGKTFLLGSDDVANLHSTLRLALHERERRPVG